MILIETHKTFPTTIHYPPFTIYYHFFLDKSPFFDYNVIKRLALKMA